MAQNNQNRNGKNQNNGGANYNGFNTAAGIAPKSTLEFTYTTQDIQEFIRKRLAAIVGSDVDNYAFCAYSEAYGKKYVPITLLISPVGILSESVAVIFFE